MEEIFLHAFTLESSARNDSKHLCVGGSAACRDRDSAHITLLGEENGDMDNDKCATELVNLMITLVKRSSVEAVSYLEADTHQHSQTGVSLKSDVRLRILAVLQVHLFGLTTSYLSELSPSNHFEGHQSSILAEQQPSTDGVICSCMVDALLLYLDALFAESTIVLKKLHKASCQHEEVVTWRLNGSFFHTLLPSAIEALCVLLPQANRSLTSVALDRDPDHGIVESQLSQLTNLGLRFAHHLLPYAHPMLKMLDEVNWKMRHNQPDNQTRHEFNDETKASLETHFANNQDSRRSWVLELQDACGVLCGKLACVVATFKSAPASMRLGTEDSGFNMFKAKLLSANVVCPSAAKASLDTMEIRPELTEILQWERNGVFEVENELEQSDNTSSLASSSEQLADAEQLTRDQRYLIMFIADSLASVEQLALWIAADEVQEDRPARACASSGDGFPDLRLERPMRAIIAVVVWNCSLVDEFQRCYDGYQGIAEGGGSSNCSGTSKESDLKRRQILQQLFQRVATLGEFICDAPSYTIPDELADTVAQNATFLLTLRPNPLRFSAIGEMNSNSDVQQALLSKLIRLVTEPAGFRQWEAIVSAQSIDTELFRIGLCFFHDLLRKLTIPSTKSYLLGELITTMRSATGRARDGTRRRQLRMQEESSQQLISKSIENLYIRLAKIISADESSPSLKEKALVAWAIPLEELTLSADAAADVIAKAGITNVIGDLFVDDVGILETHAALNQCTENSPLSDQDGAHASKGATQHASLINSGGSSWALISQRLKPVMSLLFLQTSPQSLGLISWTALCAVTLQLNKSSLVTHRNDNPLLGPGPAASLSASTSVSTRSMSGKDYASPRTAVSPRKRLTLPKRTIVSTVSDSVDQVYELLFVMLTKVKQEFDIQSSHAERISRLLATDSESSSSPLTSSKRTLSRERYSSKDEVSQALLLGNPVPISSTTRHIINRSKNSGTSARLKGDAATTPAAPRGLTVSAWIYIEHTGAAAVVTAENSTQLPSENFKRPSEPPVLFVLGSSEHETKAGVTTKNDGRSASSDAILAESELIVFTHRVASKRVALTIALKRESKPTPGQSSMTNFDADNQVEVTGRRTAPSSWELLVLSEHVQIGQWIHVAIVFQGAQNTWTAFFDGKRVGTTEWTTRDSLLSSESFPSKLRRLSVGGKLSEKDIAIIGVVEGIQDMQTETRFQEHETSNASSKKPHFEGILDDVLVLDSPLGDQDITWLSRQGPVLFQLKRQHIAESHCADLLQLLCQLVQRERTGLHTGEHAAATPLSTRWVVLFAELLDKFPNDVNGQQHYDHVQVLLRELLQQTLPEIAPSALAEATMSSIFESVFSHFASSQESNEPKLNRMSICKIYLEHNGVPNGSSLSRHGDLTRIETLQMLMHDRSLGFEDFSHGSRCNTERGHSKRCRKGTSPTQDAIAQPLLKLTSLSIAAGVRLFQSLWKSSVWRAEIEGHIEKVASAFLQTERAMASDSKPAISELAAMCSALGGYCEVTINESKAASMKTAPSLALSVFSRMESPFSSTMSLQDACGNASSASNPTLSLLRAALGSILALCDRGGSARSTLDDHCHEGTLKATKELHTSDHYVMMMVHSRASLLRFVAKASRESSDLFWQDAVESSQSNTLVEQLLHLASTPSFEFICATLGPDHKKALRLRSIRALLYKLLQMPHGKQKAEISHSFSSLPQIEVLAWKAWEFCFDRPRYDKMNGPSWWQQKKNHSHSLLEAMGGEVTIHNTTVTALEYFATVRLGGNVAIAANSGLWFYEVTMLTDGLMQIGYIDADFAPDPVQGQGVGDHASSWAFDGYRCKKWNVSSSDYGEAWRAEDVVGVLLDTDRMELSFFLNGKFLGVAFSGIPMTQTSRVCPAASINVDQAAQFNFGSSLLTPETSSQDQQQQNADRLLTFAHPPVLDSEQDQSRLQPVALAMPRPSSDGTSKRCRNLSSASKSTNDLTSKGEETAAKNGLSDDQSETNEDEGDSAAVAQSTDDEEDDDGENGGGGGGGTVDVISESFGLRLPNATLFGAVAGDDDSDARDSRSRENAVACGGSSDAVEDDALAARRNDLIDGLTGLGFPREWAIRCAIETNLSIHESGAVSWILEQMEKDATTSSDSANLRSSAEGGNVAGRQNTLFGDLPSNIRSADDLTLLTSSTSLGGGNFTLTLPSAHNQPYGLYPGVVAAQGFRSHTEHLSRNRLELFCELQTAARFAPSPSSGSTVQNAERSSSSVQTRATNLYLLAEQEDVEIGEELSSSMELMYCREYNGKGLEQLITAARLDLQPSKKPVSVAGKGSQDRTYCQPTDDADDSIPLCLTLDSLVTVLYARHALFDLLTNDRDGEEHIRQVLHFVSDWCLKADSLRRLIRFLKALVGVEQHEPVTGSSTQMLTGASDLFQTSSKLQRTFRALVTMETQEFCKTRVNVREDAASSADQQQLPVYHALFNEMRDQCIQSLTLLRGNAKKNQSTTASSVGLSAAWVLWLAGIVFPIAESFVHQHTGQTQADAAVALGPVFTSTCFSLSFVQTLVVMASGASFVTLPWKIVSFTMMKRVLCGISRSQAPVVESPSTLSGRSWASDPLKTFECAAQMHNLLDLFALRYRKENTSRVFFSSLTQAIFGLLVQHVESINYCQTSASSGAQVAHDHEARDLSHANNAGIDFCIEALASSFATVSWTQSSQYQDTSDDDGSNAGVENTVLSLSVSRLSDAFHNDLHGANDHPPRVLPSKGTYTIRNLVPDTRYVLRLSPVQTMMSLNSASQEAIASTADVESGLPSEPLRTSTATNAPSKSSPFCRELRFQTPPEPLFQLNAESMGKNLTLLNRNLSVKNLVNKKWHTVRASVGFDQGVHQWHVRIDTCVSKNIFIGVCTSQASMENYIGSDGFGYGFLANKAVWHNKSKLHSYGEIFKQGDLLQVTLDCNAKTLAFSRNGEYLGIAATNLHAAAEAGSSYASSSSLLLSTSESSKWYPAFSMYNKDDQLTIIPPSSAAMLANSARQQQQQHMSILELVEAMQVVNAYQQSTSASAASEATGNVSCFAGVRPLYTAAFKDFHRWKRGAILFRERELGHFMRIDASENATQRFGFFKGDAVFISRGQATVLGEGNHELWYECDNSGSNSSEQHTGPGLGSWSLHACRQMLASPSEFTVHRHTRRHHHHHQYPDHPPLNSAEHSDKQPLDSNSDEKSMVITAEAFEEYQKQWAHTPCHKALDAKLIEVLDGIAASRALSDPQCLSFEDISAAFLIDKVIASPLFAMLENSGAELSMKQIMARIGLLLYVNRSLCRVVRLVLAEPAPASKWSPALFSKSRIASDLRAKRETEATDDEAKDKSALSDDAKKRNAYVNAVVASDFIAGLVNSPQSNPSDPSRFISMEELATQLLFQAQKAKLMSEAMRRTATATLNSLVNSDLESQNSELTSSARDESYDPSDLPRMYVRYPVRDGSHCVPFWSDLGADPLRKSSNKETVFLVPEEGSARRHRSLFFQVSQQLQKLDPQELRRVYATPFEPLPITRTFHTVVAESTSGAGPENPSSKKAKPSTLFESLNFERKASLGDEQEGSETSCPQQQTVLVSKLAAEIQQQSQASQYVKLLEDVMREVQSPGFPLFVPLPATTSSAEAGEQSARCTIKSKSVELDVNTALFSPSVAAHCQLSSEQLLLWFVHFGQLLGIAWRSGVLLPLQFISLTFWQELVDISASNHCRGGVHHDKRHRPIVLEAIRDGLFSIVPSRCVVSLLTPAQVRSRLCDPHTHVILERIKRHAQYDTDAEHHTMFWDIVESFTAVERVALLGFLTGSSNNRWTRSHDSVQRFEFVLEISSNPLTVDSGGQQQQQQSHHPDACYPVVVSSSDIRSTRLYLPAYSSMTAMRKKLVLAMTNHCSGL